MIRLKITFLCFVLEFTIIFMLLEVNTFHLFCTFAHFCMYYMIDAARRSSGNVQEPGSPEMRASPRSGGSSSPVHQSQHTARSTSPTNSPPTANTPPPPSHSSQTPATPPSPSNSPDHGQNTGMAIKLPIISIY